MDKFFKPKSIAVIGASRNPDKVGSVILNNLLQAKFKGKIFPINPNADMLQGVRCHPSVLAVKDKIELAVISVPADVSVRVTEECGKKGIKNIIMVTAGFSEAGDKLLEKQLLDVLQKYKIKLLGPNVLGVLDMHTGLDTLFLPEARLKRPEKGGISFLCQSGAVGSTTLDLMADKGYGFAKFISYGNALNVNETDLLEYLGKDRDTKVICLYIEGIREGKRFLEAAKKISAKKPIIMVKGGMTKSAEAATFSHTASLAGSGEVYRGALKQCGIILAEDLSELFNFAKILEKRKKPNGRKVQVITNGMGYGVLSMDYIEKNNLLPARINDSTLRKLKGKMPPLVNIGNPMDLIGDATNERYVLAMDAALKDSNVDVLLTVILFQTPLIDEKLIEIVSKMNRKSPKPIVIVSTGGKFTQRLARIIEEKGLPTFVYPDEALKAVRAMCEYYHI